MPNKPGFFIETFPETANSYLKFIHVGYDNCAPDVSFSQYRNFYIVHIVQKGSGTIKIGEKTYSLKTNDAYCVRPNEMLTQTADHKNPWKLLFFAFGGQMADTLFKNTKFNNKPFFQLTDITVIDSLLKLTSENQNTFTEFGSIRKLLDLLSFFESPHGNLKTEKVFNNNTNSDEEITNKIKNYIGANYSKPIKISDIAKQFNVSRSHLYRIFKEKTDMSIEEYIIHTRINQACHLLKTTDFTANAIAFSVGYSYYPNFFKAFNKYIGTSPVKYRKSNE